MQINQLDNQLFKLTESEIRYLHHDYLDYSESIDKISNPMGKDFYQFQLSQMMTIDNNKLGYFYIRKQSRFALVPNHITDAIELNYIYHGKSKQYINDKEILLEEGDLILIDTETAHAVDIADYNDIIISINIDKEYFKKHFLSKQQNHSMLTQFLFQAISQNQNHNQYLLFRQKEASQLHLLFQQLLCEIYNPQVLDNLVKNHYFQLILLELIRSFSVEANGTNEIAHKQQLTIEILAYINSHFSHMSLKTCAQHFGYNTTYFSSLVKSYTGQSFKTLLQRKRLETSIPFLLNSPLPIRDIALEVGFSNLNQYYRLFKKHYKLTPADYRKQHKHAD